MDLFEKLIKIVRTERYSFPTGYLEKNLFRTLYDSLHITLKEVELIKTVERNKKNIPLRFSKLRLTSILRGVSRASDVARPD